jgi:hypothetical protein
MNKYLEYNDNKTIIKKDDGYDNILEYLDGIQ